MPYMTLALCAVVCTFFLARLLAAKTRAVEKVIEDTIARKLSTAAPRIELDRLREQNGVMRNLLIDMIENEAFAQKVQSENSSDRTRILNARIQRRREIFDETICLLQQTEKSASRMSDLKIRR